MPGVAIKIGTEQAEKNLASLRKSLQDAGISATSCEKQVQVLEARMMKGLNAKVTADAFDSLRKEASATSAEIVKMQLASGNVEGAFGTMGNSLKATVATLTGLKAGIAAFAAGWGVDRMINSYADLESATADMAKVTTRSYADLKTDIASIPTELASSTEKMKGYYQVLSAGITDPTRAMEVLDTALKASKASHMDLGTTVLGLTKMVYGFGGAIRDTTEASDILFKVEALGQTRFQELVPYIGDLSAKSHLAGISAKEMGAAIATVALQAGSTGEAATQLTSVLKGMNMPRATQAFREMGYASGQAAVQQLGFAGALKLMWDHAHGSLPVMQEMLGRQEAIGAMTAIANGNFRQYNINLQEMTNSAGLTNTAFGEWEKTFKAQKEAFENNIGAVFNKFGAEIVPTLTKGLEEVNKVLKEVNWTKFAQGASSFAKVAFEIYAGFKLWGLALPILTSIWEGLVAITNIAVGKMAIEWTLVNGELVIANTNVGLMQTLANNVKSSFVAIRAQVGLLNLSVSLIGAGLAGWMIGGQLYEQFGSVRRISQETVGYVHQGFIWLKYWAEVAGLGIAKGLSEPFDLLQRAFKGAMDYIRVGLEKMGAESMAKKFNVGDFTPIVDFSHRLSELTEARNKDMAVAKGAMELASREGTVDEAAAKAAADKAQALKNEKEFLAEYNKIQKEVNEASKKMSTPDLSKYVATLQAKLDALALKLKVPTQQLITPQGGDDPTTKELDKIRDAQKAIADEYRNIGAMRLKSSGETFAAENALIDAWAKKSMTDTGNTAKYNQEITEISEAKKAEIYRKYEKQTTDELTQARNQRQMTVTEALDNELAEVSRVEKEKLDAVKVTESATPKLKQEAALLAARITEASETKQQNIRDKFKKQQEQTLDSLGYDWAGYEENRVRKEQETSEAIIRAGLGADAAAAYRANEEKKRAIEKNNYILEHTKDTVQAMGAAWKNYSMRVGTWQGDLARLSVQTMDQFASGVGNAFAQVIVYGQSMSEAFGALMKNIAAMVIQTLVEIAVQRLAQWAIAQLLGTSEASSRMGTLAAETFAGAYAATVVIPVVGPILAPGVATASLAAMLSGAAAAGAAGAATGAVVSAGGGGFHGGIDTVPETGSFLLKKGERVVQPEQNRDLKAFLSSQKGASNSNEKPSVTTNTVNVSAPISLPGITDVMSLYNADTTKFENVIVRSLRSAARKGLVRGVEVVATV